MSFNVIQRAYTQAHLEYSSQTYSLYIRKSHLLQPICLPVRCQPLLFLSRSRELFTLMQIFMPQQGLYKLLQNARWPTRHRRFPLERQPKIKDLLEVIALAACSLFLSSCEFLYFGFDSDSASLDCHYH